jgi:hypothetical protein
MFYRGSLTKLRWGVNTLEDADAAGFEKGNASSSQMADEVAKQRYCGGFHGEISPFPSTIGPNC